jgi:Predicted glycosyltransferases
MRVGIVAIGRNEGQRLRACLESLRPIGLPVVYVDSGSTDGSIKLAESFGAAVVSLDTSIPFTAARARNAGFDALLTQNADLDAVQFLDGDCVLDAGWLPAATTALQGDEHLAVVFGRRRERFPQASVYNRLCDIEWDVPPGPAEACGGDALYRVQAFQCAGGFDASVIAGEEPDLCWRLHTLGFTARCLPAEMTLHDAAMTRFGQWWKRMVRAGYAHAAFVLRHGLSARPYRGKDALMVPVWAVGVPAFAFTLATFTFGLSLVALGLYPVQMWRIARRKQAQGRSAADARVYGVFTVLDKWPQTLGMARALLHRLTGRRATIIEYKSAATPA